MDGKRILALGGYQVFLQPGLRPHRACLAGHRAAVIHLERRALLASAGWAPRSFSFRLRSYFSVPIGTERLEFDGHRVFDPATILGAFRPLRLRRFSYVDDAGDLVEDADPAAVRGWHSCGLFLLRKPPGPS